MLSSRLARVWSVLAAERVETCPDCGAPVPGYTALLWIVEDEPEPRECPTCGIWLDGDGGPILPRPLRPGQEGVTKVILMTDKYPRFGCDL